MDKKIAKGLIDGKIKPEFGNIKHIEFVQNAEKNLKAFTNGVALDNKLISVDVSILIDFNCPNCCSNVQLQISQDPLKINSDHILIEFEEVTDWEACPKCDMSFDFTKGKIKIQED